MSCGLRIMPSQAVATRMGLSATDARALDFIVRYGPMTAGKLGELSGLTSGAVTGVINRLVRASCARRVPDPADGRRVIVEHTAGESLAMSLVAPIQRRTDQLLATFTIDELETLNQFLAKASVFTVEEARRLLTDV